jgi:hypothetical protein
MADADQTRPDAAISDIETRRFGAFWMGGNLSAMEQACLQTFAAQGQDVTLFSYDEIANAPPGVRRENAAEIVDASKTESFIYNNKPDIAHFSDYFRFKMFQKAALTWIDSDIVLIDPTHIASGAGGVIGREKQGTFNNAVLYISDADLQNKLIADVERLDGRNLSWGETGPLLLDRHGTEVAKTTTIYGFEKLYPIDHDDVWKVLLPEHRAWCESQCRSAATLHLFNNVIVRLGYWKSIAPPVGSYLHACFQSADALRFFEGVYPEAVMRHLAHNFVASQTGQRIGFKAVIKQFLPSVVRSYGHHRKALSAKVTPARGDGQ